MYGAVRLQAMRQHTLVGLLGPVCLALAVTLPMTAGALVDELRHEKTDWRHLASRLHSKLRNGDTVYVSPDYNDTALLYYLDRVAPPGGRLQFEPRLTRSYSYTIFPPL